MMATRTKIMTSMMVLSSRPAKSIDTNLQCWQFLFFCVLKAQKCWHRIWTKAYKVTSRFIDFRRMAHTTRSVSRSTGFRTQLLLPRAAPNRDCLSIVTKVADCHTCNWWLLASCVTIGTDDKVNQVFGSHCSDVHVSLSIFVPCILLRNLKGWIAVCAFSCRAFLLHSRVLTLACYF